MIRALGIVCFMVWASAANAASWVSVATASDGGKLLIDADSIKTEGREKTFWVQNLVVMKRTNSRTIKARTKSTKEVWKIDCENRSMAKTFYVAYDISGNNIYTDRSNRIYPVFDPIVPDSLGDAAMEFVCAEPAEMM